MTSATQRKNLEEIRLLLRKINDAWLHGHPEELKECFLDSMVITGPDPETSARGKEACVRSYEDFMRQAAVRDFRESEPEVSVWGSTAVANYHWEIHYEMNGQEHHEAGLDVFVLIREKGRWKAGWRVVLLYPPQQVRQVLQ